MDQEHKKSWLAVWCKPRQEAVAQENLQRQDFDVYLPRIRIRRRQSGRWICAAEALFPRYLFIRIDPLRRSTGSVRFTRGVIDLVRFGGRPAVVPDTVIEALLRHENSNSGLREDDRPCFMAGEPIKLIEGPFAGMEAIFGEQDGERRAIVLLELLGKTNRVRVNFDWVAHAA